MSNTSTIELTTPGALVKAQAAPAQRDNEPQRTATLPLPKVTTAVIFATVTGVTCISSLLAGLVTVALPRMAKDLDLPESLLLW